MQGIQQSLNHPLSLRKRNHPKEGEKVTRSHTGKFLCKFRGRSTFMLRCEARGGGNGGTRTPRAVVAGPACEDGEEDLRAQAWSRKAQDDSVGQRMEEYSSAENWESFKVGSGIGHNKKYL